MKVEFFTLCDYAKNDNGRLTIIDTFDTVRAEKLPWRLYFGFALKLRLSADDDKNNDMELIIYSQDQPDVPLFDVHSSLSLERQNGMLAVAGNLKGLLFEREGIHSFRIKMNGTEIFSYTFKVEVVDKERE